MVEFGVPNPQNMYQAFDRTATVRLRRELEKLLGDFAEKNGLTVSLGNARFSQSEVRFLNTTFLVKGELKREEKALEHQFSVHGLKEVNDRGDRLVEYNRRRYQYPFVFIKKADGRRYKCSLNQAKALGF